MVSHCIETQKMKELMARENEERRKGWAEATDLVPSEKAATVGIFLGKAEKGRKSLRLKA